MILSLFLLLLAFFILLNAISTTTEVKSRAVIDSLISTFQSRVEATQTAQIFVSSLGTPPQPEELIGEMERLWVSELPVAEVNVLTKGRMMQMRLPANKVFPGGKALVRKDRRFLLENMASVIATQAPGYVNEIELLIGVDWRAGEALDVGPANLEVSRAIALVRTIVEAGAPAESISMGVREGDGRELRLRFHVREAGKARIDFHQGIE